MNHNNIDKKENILLSICCLTYNHERYIQDTLDGFLIQKTNFEFEILVHDDASDDNTQNIIEKYTKLYPGLIKPIFQTENQYSQGTKPLAEFVFPVARGKYLALCEGDDFWTDPYKLQKQVDFLEANPNYSGSFTNCISLEENRLKQTELVQHSKNDFSHEDIPFYAPTLTLVFRKTTKMLALQNRNKDIPGGDLYLLTIITKFGLIKFQNFVSSVYRIHDGGMWSGKSEFEKKIHLLKTRLAIFFIADTNTLKQKLISHMEVIYNDCNSMISNSTEEKTLNELGEKLNEIKGQLVRLCEDNSNINPKFNIGYIIYGDDIINSGIIRNQVMPLLESLSQKYNYSVTVFSVIFPKFEYDLEKLDSFEKALQKNRINLKVVSSQAEDLEVARVIKQEIENKSISILHCRSYSATKLGLEIKKMINVNVIFDIRGLFPEEQKLLSLLKNETSDSAAVLFKELKDLEKDLLINSDASVSLNKSFSSHLNSEYKEIQNLFEISNFVDLKKFQFSNEDRKRVRTELGWLKNPIFVYSGAFSPWYDLELLKNWIMSISNISIESRFLILNYSDINTSIEPEVEILIELEKKLSNKLKIVKVDPDEMSCWLSASDIGMIPHKKIFKSILMPAQPIKFGEFLANGLKILALDYCKEISEFILENNGTGYLIKTEEEANDIFTDLVVSINTEADVTARMKIASLAEKYSLEKSSRKYVELYEKVINNEKNLKIKLNILSQAEDYISKEKYEKAKELLLKLLENDPFCVDALNDLAVIAIIEEKYDKAQHIIQSILNVDKSNEIALGNNMYLEEMLNTN